MSPAPLPRGTLVRLAIPAGLIFACALVLGWSAGDTTVPEAARPAPIHWSLPQPHPDRRAHDLAVVTAGRPWNRELGGGAGTAAQHAAQTAAANWRLAGIVERGGESFALISVGAGGNEKLQYLHLGDPLPDGSIVVALTRDSITAKGKQPAAAAPRVYHLFGKK